MQLRINKEITNKGRTWYIIQRKFLWWWKDYTYTIEYGIATFTGCRYMYETLEEAEAQLRKMTKPEIKERVIYSQPVSDGYNPIQTEIKKRSTI